MGNMTVNDMNIEYKHLFITDHCPKCLKTDLTVTDKKVICNFCHNWAWLEDAYSGTWLKEIKQDEE